MHVEGRACRYEVVAEYKEDWRNKIAEGSNGFTNKIYSSKDGEIYGVKPSGQKFWNVRDAKGHFIKKDVAPSDPVIEEEDGDRCPTCGDRRDSWGDFSCCE